MNTKDFSNRLADLRNQKGISARDMSLSIGQNAGYINNIENYKALPSMTNFFYICDFLEISPEEFFNTGVSYPYDLDRLISYLKELTPNQIQALTLLAKDLATSK